MFPKIHFNPSQCKNLSKTLFDLCKLVFAGFFIPPIVSGSLEPTVCFLGLFLFALLLIGGIILLNNIEGE